MTPAALGGRPTIFFLHVPKCGGQSIKHALRQSMLSRIPEEVTIELDAPASTRRADELGCSSWAFRDQLLAYHLDSRFTRAVMGHFRYTDELHGPFLDRVAFVTVLRQPVERFLSWYLYVRYKEGYARITESLQDYLVREGRPTARARSHAQLYASLFRGDGTTDSRPATTADVDAATRNLQRFALVGFLEELESFVERLEDWVDHPLEIPMLNETPAPPGQHHEMTDELREVVDEICRPAQVIYDRMREHALG